MTNNVVYTQPSAKSSYILSNIIPFWPYFTKPLALWRWQRQWTNQTAKCGKWESRATSEIFVATEVISQPVALIWRSRAQFATRVQSPPLWMHCNALLDALQCKDSTKYPTSIVAIAIFTCCRMNRYCKLASPPPLAALMDYCVLGTYAGAQKGSWKTSVLKSVNSKFLMKAQQIPRSCLLE